MVDAGSDNNRAFAMRLLGGDGEFAGQVYDGLRADAGESLLPGGAVGDGFVIAGGRVIAVEIAWHSILGHKEIQACRYRDAAIDGFDVTDGPTTPKRPAAGEIDKRDLQHVLSVVNQA